MTNTTMERRRAPVEVHVTDHARHQARKRFPDFKTARIIDEVHEAILDGRVGPEKPHSADHVRQANVLYAWTPDGERIYVLVAGAKRFGVHTTLSKGDDADD